MNKLFWKLLFSEFKRPDANMVLSILCLIVAVACAVASVSSFDLEYYSDNTPIGPKYATPRLASNTLKKKKNANRCLNALILPTGINSNDIKMGAVNPPTIPQSAAETFSFSDVANAKRIIPALERRLIWREENCVVVLCGMNGETSQTTNSTKRSNSKPPIEHPAIAVVTMGAALADTLSFSVGDTFLMNGEPLKLGAIRAEMGDVGDITIWVPLNSAQKQLKMPRRVSGIFVFGYSNLETLAQSAHSAFPNSKILYFSTQRKNTRLAISPSINEHLHKTANIAAKQLAEAKNALERNLAIFCSLSIIIIAGCFFSLCLLRGKNNPNELTMLRAYGVGNQLIFTLDILRTSIILLLGVPIGLLLGFATALLFAAIRLEMPFSLETFANLHEFKLAITTILLTAMTAITAASAVSLRTLTD